MAQRTHSSRGQVLGAILLIGITATVFAPLLGHHFIESGDDTASILTNPDYNPPTFAKLAHYWVPPPKETFYVPVTYTLWGLLAMISRQSAPAGVPFNPAFFYAANLAAHAISASLVFLILLRLFSSRGGALFLPLPTGEGWGEGKSVQSQFSNGKRSSFSFSLAGSERLVPSAFLAAWLGAALFALHPAQVEGVANAWSVYTPLSGTFGFLAIWQYMLFSQRNGRIAWAHYAAATFAFLLALLTKPTAVAVPLVIGVIDLVLQRRKPSTVAVTLAPWWALSLLIILFNEHSSPGATVFVPEPSLRPLVPLDAIGFYVAKVLVPLNLVSDYGRSPRWLMGHPLAWLTCLIPVAIFAAVWRVRKRVAWPLASFGVFVTGLLPSIGIVPFDFQHYSTVADRYLYIAMLGPAIAAAFLVARFGRVAAGTTIGLLGILTTLSVIQLGYWRDDWRLTTHTMETNPQSLAAVSGFRYLLTGWHDTHGFPAPRHCTIDQPTLVRVGDLLMSRRMWPVAAAAYRRALSRGAKTAEIYDRLGEAELRDIEPQLAADAFANALQLDRHDDRARRGIIRCAAMAKPDQPIALPASTLPSGNGASGRSG
jgi:hypothetical protein